MRTDTLPGTQSKSPAAVSNTLDAIAVAAAQAATMFGVSRAQWWKLHAMGRVPMPIYCGTKAPRWRVDELRAWAMAGAPDRETWQRMHGGKQ